uniref:Putative conserved secreted protein n=1 Tax=Ixodes scapularis TaxID=6945 RepID=A0A4D5RU86_IXOSC
MRMPFLRSLSFVRLLINPGGSAEHLATAFKGTSVLTSLKLNCSSVDPSDAKHLLQSLGSSIAELCVSGHFLQPGGGVVFANYVAQNVTLKKLRVEGCVSSETTDLDNFFKGLQSNNSLEELCLNGFSLAKPEMESLAESVAMLRSLKLLEVWDKGDVGGAPLAELVGRNTGLRELRFSAGLVRSYDAFADAIRKNTRLEKLSLNLVQHENVDVCVYRRFLEALSCNKSLQRVTLNICDGLQTAFCHILREMGTEARVDFDTCKYEVPDLAGVLSYPEPFNLRYLCIWSEVPTPSALQQLVNFHQLRSLSMYLGDDLVGGDAATCIALFLASTKTLREARFVFTTTEESTHTLLKGISCNRSISELGIGRWSFGAAEMDLVHQIIKANTVLRSLNICPRDCKKSPLLELLPKYLLDNDHLLRVHMGPVLANYPVTQQLQEVTRRNLSRLYRAVLFVTGSRGRRYADAFDRVCASPTLIKEVMKYASESEEVATQRVRSHKIYLDQHFWVEVGVVRGAMMCENSDGGVQLDQIGLDNWLCIRQFLKVADIREPPAQAAATYRPRKRRYHSR